MDEGRSLEQTAKKLSRERKVGLALMLIFAFTAVGLGAVRIRNVMYGPFRLGSGIPLSVADEINSPETLAFRDTDNDGLNDFDELYVYGTSPYLADTDSDGVSDYQEVTMGENPLCPRGGDCAAVAVSPASAAAATGTSYAALSGQSAPAANPMEEAARMQEQIARQFQDPQYLRAMLSKSGISEEDLKNISDADIVTLAANALKQQGISPASSVGGPDGGQGGPVSSASTSVRAAPSVSPDWSRLPPELAKQLQDPKQARVLLIQQGGEAALVDKMTDEEVTQAVNQLVDAVLKSAKK